MHGTWLTELWRVQGCPALADPVACHCCGQSQRVQCLRSRQAGPAAPVTMQRPWHLSPSPSAAALQRRWVPGCAAAPAPARTAEHELHSGRRGGDWICMHTCRSYMHFKMLLHWGCLFDRCPDGNLSADVQASTRLAKSVHPTSSHLLCCWRSIAVGGAAEDVGACVGVLPCAARGAGGRDFAAQPHKGAALALQLQACPQGLRLAGTAAQRSICLSPLLYAFVYACGIVRWS